MSEEEKNSIEYLKSRIYGNKGCKFIDVAQSDLRTLLNLIEKQQKEINKLKEQNKKYQGIEDGTTIIYKSKAKYVREDRIEKYYIDKNKIREKIKELENCIDKPIVKLKVLQHGFTHEVNTQFIIKTIINILNELLEE